MWTIKYREPTGIKTLGIQILLSTNYPKEVEYFPVLNKLMLKMFLWQKFEVKDLLHLLKNNTLKSNFMLGYVYRRLPWEAGLPFSALRGCYPSSPLLPSPDWASGCQRIWNTTEMMKVWETRSLESDECGLFNRKKSSNMQVQKEFL